MNRDYTAIPKNISIEQYQNLVELLKQALLFYANSGSYKIPVESDSDYTRSCMRPEFHLTRVEIDNGSQARFALEKIKEMDKSDDEMMKEFLDNIPTNIDASTEMIKTLNDLKNMNNVD